MAKPEPLVLRTVLINALMAQFENEQNLEGTKKIKRYMLAQKLSTNDSVELEAEEIAMLKDLTGKAYATVAVGGIWALLDPAALTQQTSTGP